MKTLILPLMQGIVGIAVLLLGVLCACIGSFYAIIGLILGIAGLLVCITAYLRAKGMLEESEQEK